MSMWSGIKTWLKVITGFLSITVILSALTYALFGARKTTWSRLSLRKLPAWATGLRFYRADAADGDT